MYVILWCARAWTVQELTDCVESSIDGCDLNRPCPNLMSQNSNENEMLATLSMKHVLGGNL